MSDRLRTLHADADALLATVATLAVELDPDDADLRRIWADADGLLGELVARGLEDLAGRAFPGSAGAGGPVSTSAVSDPTGAAGTRDLGITRGEPRDDRWLARARAGDEDLPTATHFEQAREARDYRAVVRTVEHVCGILADMPTAPAEGLAGASVRQALGKSLRSVVAVLERCHARLTPVATGEPCPVRATDDDGTVLVRCEGHVTHHSTGRGLCAECDADWRPRRGLEIPPEVLVARNARRRHPCTCHDTTCGHDPGGCLGLLDPGDLTGRCEGCRCACGPDCCPDGCTDPRDRPQGGALSERCAKRQYRARTRA